MKNKRGDKEVLYFCPDCIRYFDRENPRDIINWVDDIPYCSTCGRFLEDKSDNELF